MRFPLLVALSGIALFGSAVKASEFDFGIGLGPQYSGLGVSSKYFVSGSSAVGLSAGCVHLASFDSDHCGVGISYERTDLFSTNSKQHSLGLYLGIIDSQMLLRDGYYERDDVYGGGVFYTYYFQELTKPGFHAGVDIMGSNKNSGSDASVDVHFGYRF
ncbi:hypothetical protein IDSA_07035 [Pseudidiomarina salinarum]|uniref:Outer membrane protein beta-barrel domain-containing protein n=1 Tax=Pseudidiomarina salinarum TaxID=435908 RepID=A0A094IUM2_9GAMM|nr:hypothetical protein [Pseudidiomarina salinarum]KFZ30832.1 hypothetical protein IDSA_07035 [Pseudidiomarina salinarum]RUO71302.1 hypothetical protein CWI79_07720 [Pseudidiomarina salinarum]